jgi:WD40 repeat protein
VVGTGDPEPVRPLALPKSRVLLAGTGNHVTGSALPDLPAVHRSVEDLAATLVTDCGVPAANVLPLVLDPENPTAFGSAVEHAAAEARDVLLVYFAGHGLLGSDGTLYLATAATDSWREGLAFKALPYAAIQDALRGSRRNTAVVILDCCFSGRATSPSASLSFDTAIEYAHVRGGFLLAATAHDEFALAPPGDIYTALTGELIRVLQDGDPGGPRDLTLGHIARSVGKGLDDRGLPRPIPQATHRAAELVIAGNKAYRGRPDAPDTGAGPAAISPTECPYLGLRHFEPSDARYFFGRERLVADLEARLVSGDPGGVIAVVGASGSGKTSLLRAGLVPSLQAAGLEVARMTPTKDPVAELAKTLTVCGAGEGWVLVVDQFEELFTACQDDDDRRAFISGLMTAARTLGGVVISIRADFYAACLAYPYLVAALEGRQLVVEPMTGEQLRAVIEKPAQVAGLGLEPAFTEIVLRDLGSASALPLLSHALEATWRRSDRRILTIADYEAVGGVGETIARTADGVYESLDADQRDVARWLLLRLIRLGEGTDDTRRRIPLADLTGPGTLDATGQVLDALARARLIVVEDDSVTIIHEALLSAWPLLRSWIEEHRAALLMRQQLADAARSWQNEGRPPDGLYRGRRLTAASALADDKAGGPLEPSAREFLDASLAARQHEERARTRQRRRRRGLAGAVSVLVVGALVAAMAAVRLGDDSAANAARNRSEQLAADANAVRSTDPGLASQLAVAAYRAANTPQARDSLLTSLTSVDDTTDATLGTPVIGIAASPAGSTVAVATYTHLVQLWNLAFATRPVLEATIHTASLATPTFAPGGRLLAAGCAKTGICLWNVSDTRHPVLDAALPGTSASAYDSMAFSSGGNLLAASKLGGRTQVWSAARLGTPRLLATLPITPLPGQLSGLAFQPGKPVLATTLHGGATRLWDLGTPAHPVLLSVIHAGFDRIAFSPDGSTLAAAGYPYGVTLWKVSNPRSPAQITNADNPLTVQSSIVVSFSPDGQTLAVAGGGEANGGKNGAISLFDASTGTVRSSFTPASSVTAVAYEPDGTLVTGALNGTVTSWRVPMTGVPSENDGTGCSSVYECAFSPDGDLLAVPAPGSDDNIDLWDVSDPAHPALDAVLAGDQAWFLTNTTLVLEPGVGSSALWDVSDPRHPRQGVSLGADAQSAYVSANTAGNLLAVPQDDGKLLLWHVSDAYHAAVLATIPIPVASANAPGSVAITPNGRAVIVGTTTGFRIWDVSDPRHPVAGVTETLGPQQVNQPYSDITAQSEGTASMLFADAGSSQKLWIITHGRATGIPLYSADIITMTAFSADGRILAALSAQGWLMLWDTSDPGHPQNLGIAFNGTPSYSPLSLSIGADDTLAAGATGSNVELWDISNPDLPTLVTTIDTAPQGLTFAPSGGVLAFSVATESAQMVYLLDTDPASDAAELCAVTGDTITSAQWDRYAPGVPYRAPCP